MLEVAVPVVLETVTLAEGPLTDVTVIVMGVLNGRLEHCTDTGTGLVCAAPINTSGLIQHTSRRCGDRCAGNAGNIQLRSPARSGNSLKLGALGVNTVGNDAGKVILNRVKPHPALSAGSGASCTAGDIDGTGTDNGVADQPDSAAAAIASICRGATKVLEAISAFRQDSPPHLNLPVGRNQDGAAAAAAAGSTAASIGQSRPARAAQQRNQIGAPVDRAGGAIITVGRAGAPIRTVPGPDKAGIGNRRRQLPPPGPVLAG